MSSLGGCAQLLGVDDVVFHGGDAGFDAPYDAPFDAAASDASDAGVTCDASFDNDPKNCGRCGRDCLGAACTYGACEPLMVTSGTYLSSSLATDGVRVFYRDQAAVLGCAVGGCDAGELLSAAPSSVTGVVAVGPSAVYWNDNTLVRSCTKTGCVQAKTVFDAGPALVDGLAISSSHVYATGHSGSGIALFQSALDGSGFAQIELQAGATLTGAPSARTPGGVYWYEGAPTPTAFYCDTTCATGPTASKSLPYVPNAIVASDLDVYVSTANGVYRMADALGTAPALFYQGFTGALAYRNGQLFFVDASSPNKIGACSTSQTTCATPTWLFKESTTSYSIVALTADDAALYWVVRGAEQIMKVSP